ncbi:MAG: ABC transporter permease [Dehalococcoidia bacterium]
MTAYLADTFHLLQRHIRTTLRIPVWILVTLVQPVIWLALYGQLFRRVVEIPGFEASSYIQFLTPGVVIMTATFGSAWAGMGLIEDLNEGVVDRMLASPVHRGAIITARVLHAALTVTVQSAIILVMGIALGARFPGGALGLVVILLLAALLASGFSAISNGVALLTRREETLIAVVNFFGLPLTFLSTAFMAAELMPNWIQAAARVNPVNWAVNAARDAMLGQQWAAVWTSSALLAAFALAAGAFATQAFRAYRRSA